MMAGWDLKVGDRPKPISYSTLYDFNKIFKEMFAYFEAGNKEIRMVWLEYSPNSPLSHFGSLRLSQVRNWLRYHQLITVEKIKEPLEEPNGPWKNRTIWIIKPTKRGLFAYRMCDVIEVDVGTYSYEGGSKTFKVGIGKDMTYYDEMFGLADAIWKKHGIAKTRRYKWYSEIRKKFLSLVDKTRHEASMVISSWATDKAFDWNRKHRRKWKPRARIKNPVRNEATGEILLDEGQETLITFKVSDEKINP